jgi:hypothetical protein
MNTIFKIFFAAALAIFAVTAGAQTRASATPATGTSIAEGKVAVFNSSTLYDPRMGIARLVSANSVLERELNPLNNELKELKARADELLLEEYSAA